MTKRKSVLWVVHRTTRNPFDAQVFPPGHDALPQSFKVKLEYPPRSAVILPFSSSSTSFPGGSLSSADNLLKTFGLKKDFSFMRLHVVAPGEVLPVLDSPLQLYEALCPVYVHSPFLPMLVCVAVS